MNVYLTGDIHGEISRLIADPLYKKNYITEEDLIIVLGDFGVMFQPIITEEEIQLIEQLCKRPNKFLFVDGNHENHDRLMNLPESILYGGKVGVMSKDKIYHCKRGEIYTIGGLKFFTFGGANSIDKLYRIKGVSWWENEVASVKEMYHGMYNLDKYNYEVDYILAHTAPDNIAKELIQIKKMYPIFDPDPTRKYLEHVCEKTKFKKFFCGHWHIDYKIRNYNFLFKSFEKILC